MHTHTNVNKDKLDKGLKSKAKDKCMRVVLNLALKI